MRKKAKPGGEVVGWLLVGRPANAAASRDNRRASSFLALVVGVVSRVECAERIGRTAVWRLFEGGCVGGRSACCVWARAWALLGVGR